MKQNDFKGHLKLSDVLQTALNQLNVSFECAEV